METTNTKTSNFTITGVFGNKIDADNAYHNLMELGYGPEEVTLIMSDETMERMFKKDPELVYNTLGSSTLHDKHDSTISDAIEAYGTFIALPDVSLIVAGDLKDGGIRALTSSIMSDTYAEYFKNWLKDGEIVIDFRPHSIREKEMISGLWENNGGFPIIRRIGNAA